jgi:hypothetical protein
MLDCTTRIGTRGPVRPNRRQLVSLALKANCETNHAEPWGFLPPFPSIARARFDPSGLSMRRIQ